MYTLVHFSSLSDELRVRLNLLRIQLFVGLGHKSLVGLRERVPSRSCSASEILS